MTVSALIIVLFIFVLTGLIVLRPFLDQKDGVQRSGSSVYDSLLAEQERLLSAIEELDLDLELKKISPDEHGLDRQNLLAQAAEVLREMDKYSKLKKGKTKAVEEEKAIPNDDLEMLIQERRAQLKEQRTDICSACGEAIVPGDQFCSHCGEKQ